MVDRLRWSLGMKKGTKHVSASAFPKSKVCLLSLLLASFLIFSTPTAPLLPLLAAAAATTRRVSTLANQTPPDRQPAMFGGFGGGAPQRFEECYHCYSVAYADKSQLEVSQSQSGRHCQSGRTAGRRRIPHESNE